MRNGRWQIHKANHGSSICHFSSVIRMPRHANLTAMRDPGLASWQSRGPPIFGLGPRKSLPMSRLRVDSRDGMRLALGARVGTSWGILFAEILGNVDGRRRRE